MMNPNQDRYRPLSTIILCLVVQIFPAPPSLDLQMVIINLSSEKSFVKAEHCTTNNITRLQIDKLTKASYSDGYSEGFADATSGTGYSVNLDLDHTVVYKEGYANGYRDSLGGGSISTQSQA